MNLRPKLAADFVDAIMDDLRGRSGCLYGVDSATQAEMKASWEALILERFKSHDLVLDKVGDEYGPEEAKAFLAKYPGLRKLVYLAEGEARKRFEGVTFSLELDSEYDSCHTCQEGQYLTLNIQTQLYFDGDDGELEGSEYDLADDAWLDWLCSDDSPWRKVGKELGDVSDLLRTNIRSKDEQGGE
jgi:hypothetical protein